VLRKNKMRREKKVKKERDRECGETRKRREERVEM
jgi:hypothetical protein